MSSYSSSITTRNLYLKFSIFTYNWQIWLLLRKYCQTFS